MESGLLLFTVGAFICGGLAVFSSRWGPWGVMLAGVSILILGGLWGLDIVSIGEATNQEYFIGFGRIFLAFATVISGALVSTAFSELRSVVRGRKDGQA